MKKIMMSNKVLKKLVEDMKGQELTTGNINQCLREMGFVKTPDISIINGYRIDENSSWVELRSCNNKIRVTISNEGIVL